MAWDFSTDAQFEEQLEWMRAFVREEIWPIEPIVHDLSQAQLDRIYAPLQARVKERGLWAAHLDPELGGQGFGQVRNSGFHRGIDRSAFNQTAAEGGTEVDDFPVVLLLHDGTQDLAAKEEAFETRIHH